MTLNGLTCAEMPLRNCSLTLLKWQHLVFLCYMCHLYLQLYVLLRFVTAVQGNIVMCEQARTMQPIKQLAEN